MKKLLLSALLSAGSIMSAYAADVYRLVDDAASLSAGDKIIIASTKNNASTALGTTQNSNNRNAVNVTIEANAITDPGADIEVITLEESGNAEYPWLLKVSGGYLYNPSANNYLRTAASIPATPTGYQASVSISGGTTKVLMNRTKTSNGVTTNYEIMKNSSSALFACYTGTQTAIQLYRLETEVKNVATPVIELVEQGEGFAVKMTCATEGAEIRYTDDETAPTAASTLYEAPVEVWYSTTFKAVAVKDGELSNVATFTANPPYILDGFANLFDFAEGIENNQKVPVVIKGSMTAVYQSADKRYLFLNDGSKNMLVFSSSAMSETYSNGDTFSRLDGNFTKYNGQLELVDCTLSGASEGTAIAPKTYFVDMIASNVLYDYLTLENVSISGVNGKNGTITDADGNTVKLYNQLGLEGVTDMAGCTVTGFVGQYNTTIQFWPTEISAGQEVVAAPTFDPESGSSIPLYTEINIYAEESAEIYYMIEGMEEDFAPYYGPEYAFQTGTMVIKAYAKKGDVVSETVTATYTVTKPLPDLVWVNRDGQPVTEVIWVIDGTPEQKVLPEPSGMLAGEPTLTSSNPEVASINQEYMTVEVHKVGETTITISVEESFQYAAGEASFLLKVITAEDAKNINAVVEFSNPVNEGFTAAAKEKTWESTDGTFLFKAVAAISGNTTYPTVSKGQLKLYGTSNNTVTVSAPAGYRIKEVSFNKATGHEDYQDWLPTVNGTVCVLDEAQAQAEGSLNCGLALPTAVDQVVIGCGGTTKHIRLNSISFLLTDAASGIEGVETETADSAAEYYNLQGARVENPAAGLYIRRQGGKVAKVIVR